MTSVVVAMEVEETRQPKRWWVLAQVISTTGIWCITLFWCTHDVLSDTAGIKAPSLSRICMAEGVALLAMRRSPQELRLPLVLK